MRKRTTLALVSLALLGTSLAAPKKVTGYGSLGVVDGKPGGTYTLALGDSPQSLFYYGAIDNNLGLISQQLFDGLVEFNFATYKIEPALAESWTVTDGGKVYTFKLRQDRILKKAKNQHDDGDGGEQDGQHEIIVEALVGGEQGRPDAAAAAFTRVHTDTRTLADGDLFVALAC